MIADFDAKIKSVKTYESDLKTDVFYCEGLKYKDGKIISASIFVKTEQAFSPATGEDFFGVSENGVYGFIKRGDRYFFVIDGVEKNIYDGGFKSLPEVLDIPYRGSMKTFLITDGNAISVKEPFDLLPVIKGENYAYYNGVIYCVNKSAVIFDGPFGYPTAKKDASDGGMIDFGETLTGIAVGDTAFAFTENKAYSFIPQSTDINYSIETVYDGKGVRGETAEIYKNGCLFVCGKDLIFSDGKSVKTVYKDFLPYGFSPYKKPSVICGEYLLPVKYGDSIKVVVFDGENRYFIDAQNLSLLDSETAAKDGYIYKLSEGDGDRSFISENLSLGSDRLKTVCGITVELYGENLSMTVSGDFGERTFPLKDGQNFLRVSLSSKRYAFRLSGKVKEIKKVTINYRNREILYGI